MYLVMRGMVVIKKFKFSFLLLFILISFPLNVKAENSIYIPKWNVESELHTNGDLYVEEDITFDFSGEFNGVFREIVLNKTNGTKDIKVFEIIKGKEIEYNEVVGGKNGDTQSYEILGGSDRKLIKIFSPSKDEKKTFRLKYTVKDVAIKYNDTGELNYKFLGNENKTDIAFFSVNIKLPKNKTNEVKIFAHGPLNCKINFTKKDTIHMEVKNVPPNTFIEGRILFPVEFIHDSYNLVDKNTYNEIIDEEINLQREITEKAIKAEKRKSTFNNIALIIGGAMVIVITLIMSSLRRKINIYEKVDSNPLPDECTPAVASYLLNYSLGSNAVMATILDLTRKGYINIEDGGEYKKKTNNIILTKMKEDGNLFSHEIFFMNWLFKHIGTENTVETENIEEYAKKNYTPFGKSYAEWQKKVKEDAFKLGYFDNKGKSRGIILLILSSISFAISIISLAFGSMFSLFPLFASIFGIIYSITLSLRRSDLGFKQSKKWTEFTKYMKVNRSDLDSDIFKYPLDTSLIYALALGVNRKDLNKYKIYTEKNYGISPWVYWYFYTAGHKDNAFDKSINRAFGSVTSGGSSTGSGGSFSGGGGGAGGGGAGGF